MIANKLRGGAPQPTKKYTASGALSTGDLVVLNADNTVSVVAESTTNVSQSYGSPTTFEGRGSCEFFNAVFDPNTNKVIAVYQYYSQGWASVGTVSGTSISWGTPINWSGSSVKDIVACMDTYSDQVIVCYDHQTAPSKGRAKVLKVSGTSLTVGGLGTYSTTSVQAQACCFDSNTNKVVVTYAKYGGYAQNYCAVGTVSGTSISFGAETIYNSANTGNSIADMSDCIFDPNTNKVYIFYHLLTTNSLQNRGKALVATVSGTSISFGSPSDFNSTGQTQQMNACMDTNTNKIILGFHDLGTYPSNYPNNGKVIIGTPSSTSISWGSKYTLTASNGFRPSIAFDPIANKCVVSWGDAYVTPSWYGSFRVGTVSGTSISFGTKVTYNSATTYVTDTVFDSNENKIVTVYRDYNTAPTPSIVGWGKAIAIQCAYLQINANLTSSNFIGISDGTYADTSSATIKMNRATDNTQSGLTTGSTYYAQTDGTLSTTADSPSVSVGVARTSTSIKIKGSNA